MQRLNYQHLLYFWMVAREGSITRACSRLHRTEPTISGQLRALEKALDVKLFERAGRNLVLTEIGREVYRYAEDIFALGQELQDRLKGQSPGRPRRLVVGVVEALPKIVACRLIEPALHLPEAMQIVCEQGKPDHLLAQLALHALDLVLADGPVGPAIRIHAYNHLLGECGVSFVAAPTLAAAHRPGFPASLDGAPFLLPGENTMLRRSLEQWFETTGVRPVVRGEFADSSLLKAFGQKGTGVFVIHTAVERETLECYNVRLLGRIDSIRERFYAISLEKKITHPAVAAITQAARQKLFA